jgi:hypothetical protein
VTCPLPVYITQHTPQPISLFEHTKAISKVAGTEWPDVKYFNENMPGYT